VAGLRPAYPKSAAASKAFPDVVDGLGVRSGVADLIGIGGHRSNAVKYICLIEQSPCCVYGFLLAFVRLLEPYDMKIPL
jgi:hypothetical protein